MLFSKCYTRLTGKPLPLNHPLRPSLIAKTLTAEAACLSLLDKAKLDSTTGRADTDPEAQAVLRNFFEFHRTWFAGAAFEKMQGFVAKRSLATHDMYEPSEGALAATFVLFSEDASENRFDQLLRSSHGYYALRELDPSISVFKDPVHPLPTRRFYNPALDYSAPDLLVKNLLPSGKTYESSDVVPFSPLQTGFLVGIQPDTRVSIINNYDPMIAWLNSTNVYRAPVPMENAVTTPGLIASFNLFATHGGGVLGQNPNMLINWGHESGRLNDGSLKMPRRWAQESLKSLLCKELPALRASDVGQFVDSSNSPDVADFRKSTSCVQCHATMDQLASVTRNYFVADTDYWFRGFNPATGKIAKMGQVMGRATASLPSSATWSSTPIKDFHRQIPLGRVFFRSFAGNLVNVSVTGIDGAGEVLAKTDDFYTCAAKRYFEFFTGFEVKLFDPGDPQNATLLKSQSAEAREHRTYIDQLALQLKSSQSSRTMVKSILKSKYFLNGSNP